MQYLKFFNERAGQCRDFLSLVMAIVILGSCMLTAGCGAKRGIPANVRNDLKSNDFKTRYHAVEELSLYQNEDSIQLLIAALSDPERGIRIVAVETLGRFNAHEATPALVRALGDKDMWVRGQAAAALGEMNEQVAVEPLINLIGVTISNTPSGPYSTESYGRDADAACRALKEITGKDYGGDIQKWNAWLATTKQNK